MLQEWSLCFNLKNIWSHCTLAFYHLTLKSMNTKVVTAALDVR